MFAKKSGWGFSSDRRIFYADNGASVFTCTDPADWDGVKRAIVHIGIFDKTTEGQALKRWLVNRAEARHFHLIEYNMDGDRPEPIRICQVCGRDRPCMWPDDVLPGEPGVPCTFDPSIHQVLARLRAEEKKSEELQRSLKVLAGAYFGICSHIKEIQKHIEANEKRGVTQISQFSRRVS